VATGFDPAHEDGVEWLGMAVLVLEHVGLSANHQVVKKTSALPTWCKDSIIKASYEFYC